jgi:hypothetical protein
VFARTLEEHNANVRQYQLSGARRSRPEESAVEDGS